jgi:DNA polymerase-1
VIACKELLEDLHRRGFTLSADGPNIRISPFSQLTPDLRQAILHHKPELLVLVAKEPAPNETHATRDSCDYCDNAGEATPSISGDDLPVTYTLVGDSAGLLTVKEVLESSQLVGLDLETSGLNPRLDRVRLLSLAADTSDDRMVSYLVDCFAVDPSPLWDILAGKPLVGHNLAFDLQFLERMGFTPQGRLHDTMLLSQLLYAGQQESHKLQDCVRRELGISLSKEAQRSDWSSSQLTPEQWTYAARDAIATRLLRRVLQPKINDAGLADAALIERQALPTVVWLSGTGAMIDSVAWQSLAADAERDVAETAQKLNGAAPPKPDGGSWNWASSKQVKEALALAGCSVENTRAETLALVEHELARLLHCHRDAAKRATTYGTAWLTQNLDPDGRVYADWHQLGTASGRMSCSGPNMQQLPRGAYRKCVVAQPGCVLLKADYSQIELRCAARIAGEQRMIAAYKDGQDLHTLTAQRMTGKEAVTKDERGSAKAVNFGLIYGMSAAGLVRYAMKDYGVRMTLKQAQDARRAFFAAWPEIAKWHVSLQRAKWQDQLQRRPVHETRTLAGRRSLVKPDTWYGGRAARIVSGTAADGYKCALGLLWRRRAEVPGVRLVLAVHDEVVVEVPQEQVEAAAAWLKQAMLDGMAPFLDPVPVDVELMVGESWGEQCPLADWLTKPKTPPPSEQSPSDRLRPLLSSASAEWYTPPEIIAAVKDCLGTIELDPSSNSHSEPAVPAERHFTAQDDGLIQPWEARSVYLHPPYGRKIGAWVNKLLNEYHAGRVQEAIALLPARTDTAWFRPVFSFPVCYLHGRLRFSGCVNPAPFPSALVYLGSNPERFRKAVAHLGSIAVGQPPASDGQPAELDQGTTSDSASAAQPKKPLRAIRWHGGKGRLARRIIALMPPHIHYVEPFCGGCSILLAHPGEDRSELINDLDGWVTNFWGVLRDADQFERFRRGAEATLFSRGAFKDARATMLDRDPASLEPWEAALAFFICSRQSMGGRMDHFSPPARQRLRHGMNGCVSGWVAAVDGLPDLHARMRRVFVEHMDALKLIPREDTPGTLFYVDPPYLPETRTSPKVYAQELSEADHRKLLEVLRVVQGKVMLSGYPSELYDQILSDWTRHTFTVPNNAAHGAKKSRRTEALWCNF